MLRVFQRLRPSNSESPAISGLYFAGLHLWKPAIAICNYSPWIDTACTVIARARWRTCADSTRAGSRAGIKPTGPWGRRGAAATAELGRQKVAQQLCV